jgi:2-polyprenyl-3-methyl-5-hydroxy-6-metoxy-1,4-benzoquinol methylase
MESLLPDRLKEIWGRVDAGQLTADVAQQRQEVFLDEYRAIWTKALVRHDEGDLKHSLLKELAAYLSWGNLDEIEARCRAIGQELKSDWERIVKRDDASSIERFYDKSHAHLFELTWWHTLADDQTPLAYVLALDFACRRPGRRYLDFGAGVGSGAILFATHGFEVALADISSPLLRFAEWRLTQRGLTAQTIDLKTLKLPTNAFDVITTMDVFEHLADPVAAVDQLAGALRPGGHIFGRFAAEKDPERPQHILFDFESTFRRLATHGLVEVWRDQWLWGHQVFQKPL